MCCVSRGVSGSNPFDCTSGIKRRENYCVMNPSVSCSSEERGEDNSWVCESWDNPAPATAMSVGLETARQFHGRLDWDWDNTAAAATVNNPLLLSHHHRNHHHHQQQQHHHHHHHEQSDSDEQKPHIMPPQMAPFRQYNGMGLGFPSQHHQNHALGMLNSSGMRSFGDSNSGLPTSSSSSFHPSLLYSEMPAFAYGGCDSRSQLAQMMSMQNHHHHHKQGTGTASAVFHDIVKREDLEYQATMLNLGHRTYFSSEDTAVSRLYKRSRAIPPSSQAPRCQAEGCKADLSNAKHYHRRHKVCEFHSKAPTVVTGGVHQRFCQQCSRFHALSEFDEVKRSCRKRLADHNRRRRKPQPNTVSSNTETPTAALKAEEDEHSPKNGSGSSDTPRGVQVAPPVRTESQALMSAMPLPLMLQNSKGQINPNPNAITNGNANPNPNALQHNSHKSCQEQYNQKGPNLSMGLCNQRTQQAAAQEYSGLELALPWLRPTSEYGSSHHRPSPPMDILQPIISEKSDVENFSSSIQNFLPLSASSSRELGASSQWMVGNSDHESGHEHEQQMFSLLESPAAVRTDEDSSAAVEYLSHRRHQGGLGLNSKDATMQSLRPFGQSIYDSTL